MNARPTDWLAKHIVTPATDEELVDDVTEGYAAEWSPGRSGHYARGSTAATGAGYGAASAAHAILEENSVTFAAAGSLHSAASRQQATAAAHTAARRRKGEATAPEQTLGAGSGACTDATGASMFAEARDILNAGPGQHSGGHGRFGSSHGGEGGDLPGADAVEGDAPLSSYGAGSLAEAEAQRTDITGSPRQPASAGPSALSSALCYTLGGAASAQEKPAQSAGSYAAGFSQLGTSDGDGSRSCSAGDISTAAAGVSELGDRTGTGNGSHGGRRRTRHIGQQTAAWGPPPAPPSVHQSTTSRPSSPSGHRGGWRPSDAGGDFAEESASLSHYGVGAAQRHGVGSANEASWDSDGGNENLTARSGRRSSARAWNPRSSLGSPAKFPCRTNAARDPPTATWRRQHEQACSRPIPDAGSRQREHTWRPDGSRQAGARRGIGADASASSSSGRSVAPSEAGRDPRSHVASWLQGISSQPASLSGQSALAASVAEHGDRRSVYGGKPAACTAGDDRQLSSSTDTSFGRTSAASPAQLSSHRIDLDDAASEVQTHTRCQDLSCLTALPHALHLALVNGTVWRQLPNRFPALVCTRRSQRCAASQAGSDDGSWASAFSHAAPTDDEALSEPPASARKLVAQQQAAAAAVLLAATAPARANDGVRDQTTGVLQPESAAGVAAMPAAWAAPGTGGTGARATALADAQSGINYQAGRRGVAPQPTERAAWSAADQDCLAAGGIVASTAAWSHHHPHQQRLQQTQGAATATEAAAASPQRTIGGASSTSTGSRATGTGLAIGGVRRSRAAASSASEASTAGTLSAACLPLCK